MYRKKKKVELSNAMVLYGVGQKTIVKYLVAEVPGKEAFKLQIIGDSGRASSFTYRGTEFFEGDTLYKHGYRMYRHSAQIEKKYVSYLVRHNLYGKLKKIYKIMDRINNLSMDKMLRLSFIFDKMIADASEVDGRIKKM